MSRPLMTTHTDKPCKHPVDAQRLKKPPTRLAAGVQVCGVCGRTTERLAPVPTIEDEVRSLAEYFFQGGKTVTTSEGETVFQGDAYVAASIRSTFTEMKEGQDA